MRSINIRPAFAELIPGHSQRFQITLRIPIYTGLVLTSYGDKRCME